MKLPADAVIAVEKFTQYLLVPQMRSDKSRYLASAGYAKENVTWLIDDLRRQILPLDATPSRSSQFGETWVIDGPLAGPSGAVIHIRTVWLREALSGAVHFVTLIPQPQHNA